MRNKVASLFAGIGGFDLGFERAGFEIVLQCEIDKWALDLLCRKWPKVEKIKDVKNVERISADIIVGGDPCQARSKAKGSWKSKHPDLAGYFLALVGRSAPRWVVRENVRSSDVGHFAFGLGLLGYSVAIVELDALDFTSQSRRRQFVIGCSGKTAAEIEKIFADRKGDGRHGQKTREKEAFAQCITAHHCRISESDTIIYEDGDGLRYLTEREVEALQGFPRDWTAGFSRYRRARLLGAAVPPPMTEWIAQKIMKEELATDEHR